MTPRLRKFALIVHLTVSVGWLGAVAAYLALDVTVATSQDVETLRAAYVSMDLIASWVIVPLAIATVLTGLIMALATKWGLFRHYWVLISFFLTVVAMVVLLVETQTIGALADAATDPARSDDDVRSLPNTLPHSVGGLIVLLVVLVLNVYKPRGLTKYGWRKEQDRGRQAIDTGPRKP